MTYSDMVTKLEVREGRYALVFNTNGTPKVKLFVDDKEVYSDIPTYLIVRMADLLKATYERK